MSDKSNILKDNRELNENLVMEYYKKCNLLNINACKIKVEQTGCEIEKLLNYVPSTNIFIPKLHGNVAIGEYAFARNIFNNIIINDKVTKLGQYCFIYLKANKVELHCSCNIGHETFFESNIKTLIFYDTVTCLESNSLSYLKADTVKLIGNIQIGQYAFQNLRCRILDLYECISYNKVYTTSRIFYCLNTDILILPSNICYLSKCEIENIPNTTKIIINKKAFDNEELMQTICAKGIKIEFITDEEYKRNYLNKIYA